MITPPKNPRAEKTYQLLNPTRRTTLHTYRAGNIFFATQLKLIRTRTYRSTKKYTSLLPLPYLLSSSTHPAYKVVDETIYTTRQEDTEIAKTDRTPKCATSSSASHKKTGRKPRQEVGRAVRWRRKELGVRVRHATATGSLTLVYPTARQYVS